MSLYARAVRARAWMGRPLQARWDAVARDARMLFGALRGEPLPGPRVFAAAPASRRLVVEAVVRETADAVTLRFAASPALTTWRAGEFLTLGVRIDGAVHRRAYSLSSAPGAARASVTIKRVADGLVSGWLVDHARPGLELEVQGPSGRFVYDAPTPTPAGSPDAAHLVLVGGGSGITPLRAILEHALAHAPGTRVTLVYGNRRADDIIFARDLAALVAAHPERLVVRHALEEPPDGWTGAVGRLDAARLATLLPDDAPDADGAPGAPATSYWLCGPTPMMAAAREVLAARGVAPARVHEERFLALGSARAPVAAPSTPQPLVVHLAGRRHRVTVAPGQTLLAAGAAAGLPLASSCQLGGCGACRVRLRSGEVAYDTPSCLTADEVQGGYALACVARPLGPVEIEAEPA